MIVECRDSSPAIPDDVGRDTLRGIRILVIDAVCPAGSCTRGGEALERALLDAGADACRCDALGDVDYVAKTRWYDLVLIHLNAGKPAIEEGGVNIARRIASAFPWLAVFLFSGHPTDPTPEFAVRTGWHHRLVDLVRLTGVRVGAPEHAPGPRPRLVPFVHAAVAASRARQRESGLRASLPLPGFAGLPEGFKVLEWLERIEHLLLRCSASHYATEEEAAAALRVSRSRFRKVRDAASGQRPRADAPSEPRRVLLYPVDRRGGIEAALTALGLEPIPVRFAHRVSPTWAAERAGVAILQTDDGNGVVAAHGLLRLQPSAALLLDGPVHAHTLGLAGQLGVRDRLIGDLTAESLAECAVGISEAVRARATLEVQLVAAGRPDLGRFEAPMDDRIHLDSILSAVRADVEEAARSASPSARKRAKALGVSIGCVLKRSAVRGSRH